jgi:predicted phage terminase large subunit-like protein
MGVHETASPDRQSLASNLLTLARRDFWAFVEFLFPVLHPGQRLEYADYLLWIACVLEAAEAGGERRVIFNMPPRHMKSVLISILFPAWVLGRDPTAKFICVSYGDDLAHEHSVLTRKVMMSSVYRRIFPKTLLDKKAQDHIRTTKGGQRYATAVASDITGFGADYIIFDDPLEPLDAASESAKQRVRDFFGSSVMTRLNDHRRGRILIVMHRLAPDDLCGTLEATGDYMVVKLRLIAEASEEFYDADDRLIYSREPGDILNSSRYPRDMVERLKASLPAHVFDGQYQQRPSAGGSGMLSLDKFRRYDHSAPPKFDSLIHSWDIGATVSGNPTVCTSWGLCREGERNVVYLLEVARVRLEVPDVRAAIIARDRQDKPDLIILDERGVDLGVLQDLQHKGFRHAYGASKRNDKIQREDGPALMPGDRKIDRFGRAPIAIGDGRVLLPKAAPWLEKFLYEVGAFPNAPEDDQVDSMTQLVAHLDRAAFLARRKLRP